MKWIGRVTPKLPQGARFLVAPLLATAIFVIAWSGAHKDTGSSVGLLPQNIFPAVIGLFTYGVARYGQGVQCGLVNFFELRDKFPRFLRLLVVIAVPITISLAITVQQRVTMEALKEQFVVMVALATGYLMISPRNGDLLSGARQMMTKEGSR